VKDELNNDIAVVVNEKFVAVLCIVCVLPNTGLVDDVVVCVPSNKNNQLLQLLHCYI